MPNFIKFIVDNMKNKIAEIIAQNFDILNSFIIRKEILGYYIFLLNNKNTISFYIIKLF